MYWHRIWLRSSGYSLACSIIRGKKTATTLAAYSLFSHSLAVSFLSRVFFFGNACYAGSCKITMCSSLPVWLDNLVPRTHVTLVRTSKRRFGLGNKIAWVHTILWKPLGGLVISSLFEGPLLEREAYLISRRCSCGSRALYEKPWERGWALIVLAEDDINSS